MNFIGVRLRHKLRVFLDVASSRRHAASGRARASVSMARMVALPTIHAAGAVEDGHPSVTVWANGRLVDPAEPVVSAIDHGLVVGDGVFEACKVVNGRPFALTRHLRRLGRSAAGLGLRDPDTAMIRDAVGEVLGATPLTFGKLRITWTDGLGPLGSGRDPDSTPTLVVAAAPATPAAPEAVIHTVPWTRNERGALAGLKTTSYADNVLALARAAEHGASEAIFGNTAGHLCEGTGSNIFLVLDGVLTTPPLSSGCLAGITRELVLEWTSVVERDVTFDEAARASEVLLTSSLRDVQPVVRWDARSLPGAAGAVARRLSATWSARSTERVDP